MSNQFALGSLALALAATALGPASAADSRSASCASADVDARITSVASPVRPTIAVAQGATGRAIVEVKLSPSGAVVAARITESSNNKWLDREALNVAHQSTFKPAIHDCNTVGGSYRLTVEFAE